MANMISKLLRRQKSRHYVEQEQAYRVNEKHYVQYFDKRTTNNHHRVNNVISL